MASDIRNTPDHSTNTIRNMILGLDVPVELKNKQIVPAINFDNAATTPPFQQAALEVSKQMMRYGSIGRGTGQKSEYSTEIYTGGRDIVKNFVGANGDQYTVFYCSCTTDGINKLASALIETPDDIVLTTRMEHHSNDLPWRERARTLYAEVDENGRLVIDDVERILAAHGGAIKCVSVTAASNVTGYVNDVHRIAKIAHDHGALIIVDGAQIIAHQSFSMIGKTPDENIDFLVFSSHKMYSPYGCGAVVGLTEVLDRHIPKFCGGGMVESVCDMDVRYSPAPDRYEAGSPNYPGVVGMLKAMEILGNIGFKNIETHEQQLLQKALQGLKCIPGVILYGDSENISDRIGIVVFNLDGLPNAQVAHALADRRAIAVRHAAFCAHPYVRRLMNAPNPDTACDPPEGMVRISFGIYNTEKELDCLLATIRELLQLSAPHA